MRIEKLYDLSFFSDTEEEFGSGLHIGLFRSWEEAEQVAHRYRREVLGFKDFEFYTQAQQRIPRQEWALNCHIIGQCDWQEGFVRELPGGQNEEN